MKNECFNNYCYISGEMLEKNNSSEEHIIPNALGGHLKSHKLVTAKINNTLFASLDAELANAIELSKLITFKRDRGEQPALIGTSNKGLRYKVKNNTYTCLPLKPIEFIDPNGKINKKIPESQLNQFIKSILKDNPSLNKEDILKKVTFVTENEKKNIHFNNGLNIITNAIQFRGIAKIASNFAILNNIMATDFNEIINFIKGANNFEKIKLGYFYPSDFLEENLEDKEISHILYLKGCRNENLLYCYIELFNTHCFIIILNQNYCGDEINTSYVWDVLNSKKINKKINLFLTRDFLFSRDYMFYTGVEQDYIKRLKRTNEICGLNITF